MQTTAHNERVREENHEQVGGRHREVVEEEDKVDSVVSH